MVNPADSVMDGLINARATLEVSSDRWANVMVIATILVAVGVIIEVWATVLEVRDELRDGHKLKAHHILTFAGAAFVAAFVALECVAEYKTSVIETRLRSNNAVAQSELTKRANEATRDAVELTEKFGGLHDFVLAEESGLDSTMDGFKRYAENEHRRAATVIGELNRDKDQLNEAHDDTVASAAKVKSALAEAQRSQSALASSVEAINELQQQLRDLTIDRTISIAHAANRLASFSGTPFDVETSEGREVDLMALQITSALGKANWDWKPDRAPDNGYLPGESFPDKPFMRSRTFRGIAVEVASTDSKELHAARDALIAALDDEGIKGVTAMELSDDDANKLRVSKGLVHIVIGTKH